MRLDAFEDWMIPFDRLAPRAYGVTAAGRLVAPTHWPIAAIAATLSMTVARRNIRGFEGTEISIVDTRPGACASTTEVFSRVKIDALLRDPVWNPMDATSCLGRSAWQGRCSRDGG